MFTLRRAGAIICGVAIALGSSPVMYAKSKSSHTKPIAIVTSRTPLPVYTSESGNIVIKYVNPLRYQYSTQVSSANISAPAVPTALAPAPSTTGTLNPATQPSSPETHGPSTPPPTIEEQWKQILQNLKTARDHVLNLKQQTDRLIIAASIEAQCYKDRLSYFSPYLLDEANAALLKLFINNNEKVPTSTTGSVSDSCRRDDNGWPYLDLQMEERQIYQLQGSVFDLMMADGFSDWKKTNADAYSAVATSVGTLLTEVQGLEGTSDSFKGYQTTQAGNLVWRVRIHDIADRESDIARTKAEFDTDLSNSQKRAAYAAAMQRSGFLFTVHVNCSTNWYGRGRTDTITLHYTDMSATSPSDQTSQIAISTCYTPATVSTGIGMSMLRNQQFAFVSGRDPTKPTNTISVIGTTTDQLVTPLYALQYNIALVDLGHGMGLHAAVGAALGSSSGTANIELIAGPAISVRRRAFFITPAFQLGRRDNLLPGFAIGDPQGNGLTAIPVHSSWRPGFALTFTFSVSQ